MEIGPSQCDHGVLANLARYATVSIAVVGESGARMSVISRILQPYWRLTRGMTLGVRGVIVRDRSAGATVDESESVAEGRGGLAGEPEVLLIRHGYQPGWNFPGGGVEWRETLLTALTREVEEESGVVITGTPDWHGIFANIHQMPSDHVAVYVIRQWEQPCVPAPNFEIAEQSFFPISALPGDMSFGARQRIGEIFHGAPVAEHWGKAQNA
jgi:ADP-ribose pyrophosphatase YjhB (NUDIX family)